MASAAPHPPDPAAPPPLLRRSAYEPVPAVDNDTRAGSCSPYSHDLTLLSWNVLADGLAQTDRWAHCPPAALEWPARRTRLLCEVDAARPDIVCLQECNHYTDFWAPEMAARGFDGAFWAKPGSPAARAGAPPDGCAVFFRANRFAAAAVLGEAFSARCAAAATPGGGRTPRPGAPAPDNGATDEEPYGSRVSDRGGAPVTASGESLPAPTPPRGVQGCLVVTLTDALSGRPIIVACTHLKAKAGEEEEVVRRRQAAEAVARLRQAAGEARSGRAGAPGAAHPVQLLAGDFNAGPASAAAQAPVAAGLASVWGEADGRAGGGGGGSGDRVASTAPSPPTPWPWSTFKYRTAGVGAGTPPPGDDPAPKASAGLVDHVFYDAAALAARWPPLGRPPAGLPCAGYPSDHAAVAVQFKI